MILKFSFLVPSFPVSFQRFLRSSCIHAQCFGLLISFQDPNAEVHSLQSVQRQWEVYTWRVIKNWGVNIQNILGNPLYHVAT